MRIGITSAVIETVRRSGVKMQGLMWHEALSSRGHDVTLINYWDDIDYSEFDAVIILRWGSGLKNIAKALSSYNIPVISAPIFDPHMPVTAYRLAAKFGHIDRLHMSCPSRELFESVKHVTMFLARSEYEREYLMQSFEIPAGKIRIVPLPFRIKPAEVMPTKENFCFHVSNLNAHNKNVPRLIEAAKKYGFRLILGGSVRGDEGRKQLEALMAGNGNITYTGQLTDEELRSYYMRAKVFALPSLWEGVGMVALEAAACGCGIVMTNHGAPKEYYSGLAELVNPKSSDDIGRAVMKLLDAPNDSRLMEHVKAKYSAEKCAQLLDEAIASCLKS
ncbi:MAG: glycosyltransferase family 4 protein [Synergistaceae bacterium]|nr:glycosyltransferase family 4 protein [Synergistaceae bacterium]